MMPARPVREKIKKTHKDELKAKWERIRDEKIHVLRVGGIDAAACAGTHVARTGEMARRRKDPSPFGAVVWLPAQYYNKYSASVPEGGVYC
jgi:hypothetical protein